MVLDVTTCGYDKARTTPKILTQIAAGMNRLRRSSGPFPFPHWASCVLFQEFNGLFFHAITEV